MFNFFKSVNKLRKQQISKEKLGQELWQSCCDTAEEFCSLMEPELKEEGFIRNPVENNKFLVEVMILHLWIISSALGNKDQDVLDILHNNFRSVNPNSYFPDADGNIRDRFHAYYDADKQDLEDIKNKVPWPQKISKTALRCFLVNNDRPGKILNNPVIAEVIFHQVYGYGDHVRKFRAQFDVCG
jgi:hypothetical protein